MPVTVPVSNQSSLQFSNPSSSLVTPSLVTSSLTDPRLLSPQQPALQRNSVSPGLPQRPASAGEGAGEGAGEVERWKGAGVLGSFALHPHMQHCSPPSCVALPPGISSYSAPHTLGGGGLTAHDSAFPAGAMLGGDLTSANGACPSPVGECYCPSTWGEGDRRPTLEPQGPRTQKDLD